MNITPSQNKVLMVIVRLAGLHFLIDAVISFTYVPERLMGLLNSHYSNGKQFYGTEIGMLLFRAGLEIALGIIFLAYAGAIVEKLSRGLIEEVSAEQTLKAPISSPTIEAIE